MKTSTPVSIPSFAKNILLFTSTFKQIDIFAYPHFIDETFSLKVSHTDCDLGPIQDISPALSFQEACALNVPNCTIARCHCHTL